jgi:hypothetical protein
VEEAVRYYQTASYRFTHGLMADLPAANGAEAARH